MLALAVVVLIGIMSFGTKSAHAAATVQICFALDGSGSISGPDFTLQKDGVASATETVLPHDGSVEITVLQFSSAAKLPTVSATTVTVANAEPPGNSTLGNLIRGMVKSGGGTNIGAALNACINEINGSAKASTSTVRAINLSTDGFGSGIASGSAAAQAAGITRLDFEAVGPSTDVVSMQAAVFAPGFAKGTGIKLSKPFAPPPAPLPGIVFNVATFAQFELAVQIKTGILVSAPSFIPPSPCLQNLKVEENFKLQFDVQASDADPTPPEAVSLGVIGLPPGATFPIPPAANPVTGTFNWTPALGQAGPYVVTFTATDVGGASAAPCVVNIQVNPKSATPTPTFTATPTVTPTPEPPVGGIGVFPDSGDSSGSSVAVFIGLAAIATAIALAGAAWSARRRWAR